MKNFVWVLLLTVAIGFTQTSEAQFLDKIKKKD
jgi:hypothetical protein